jgi:hypothetical protein
MYRGRLLFNLVAAPFPLRRLHAAPQLRRIVPFTLADIGEGIAEAQLLQW